MSDTILVVFVFILVAVFIVKDLKNCMEEVKDDDEEVK